MRRNNRVKKIIIDMTKIKTYPLKSRKSKVSIADFAKEVTPDKNFQYFIAGLPDILAGKNLKNVIKLIFKARQQKKPMIWMFGAHVIKCGLSPLILQLAREGFVTAIAINGAGIIHDFEIAYAGRTSEDVAVNIQNGTFGMAEETSRIINQTISQGARNGLGLGEAMGQRINEMSCKYARYSILAQAHKLNIPVTVHAAIGTDIIYQHPSCDAAAIGETSYRDFHTFAAQVAGLGNGGVLLNFGSAFILPEVFLKAVTICRNLGYKLDNFTTANFDMVYQYRPQANIVTRPVGKKGQGYNFVAQHEIIIPLLAKALVSAKRHTMKG